MTKLPLPNRVTVIVVLAMATVQLFLVYSFWGTMGGGDPVMAFAMQALGIGLAVFELVALVVASHADQRGQPGVAAGARMVVSLVFILNLLGDIGAIATFTHGDAEKRQLEVATYDASKRQSDEVDSRIAALRTELEASKLNIPAAAIEVQLTQMRESFEQSGLSSETRAWRQRRAAELESALITARELERLVAERGGEGATGNTPLVRPEESHPQFESLSRIAGWMGIDVAPDDLRVGLALFMAIVVRAVLLIGLWLALPSHGLVEAPPRTLPEKSGSGSSGNGEKKKSWLSWIWPKKQEVVEAQMQPVTPEDAPSLARQSEERPALPVSFRPAPTQRAEAQAKPAKLRPGKLPRGRGRTASGPPSSLHHGDQDHDPKTCPTCNSPVAEDGLALLEALDELDPVH
jgi:hypothetical protein